MTIGRKTGGRKPRLSESKVRMIRIMWRDNPEISLGMMAQRFEISRDYCRRVIRGHVWPGLPIHAAHPKRAEKIRGYGDTNVKRNKEKFKLDPKKVEALNGTQVPKEALPYGGILRAGK